MNHAPLRFLVDEDMPRILTNTVRASGQDVEDVRDVGLRGKPDEDVFEYAVRQGRTILTGDRGFGSTIRFALGSHAGIVVIRYPGDTPLQSVAKSVVSQLQDLSPSEVRGSVVVLEDKRVRVRSRKPHEEDSN